MRFENRREAGKRLAEKLDKYRGKKDTIVLGLPKGGVPVAYEIAQRLSLPMDIVLIKKISHPQSPEFAIGAVGETNKVHLNEYAEQYNISSQYIKAQIELKKEVIKKLKQLFRNGRDLPCLTGKTIILTDDGVATGATVQTAINILKEEHLRKFVLALPVSPPDTARKLRKQVDELICLYTPHNFSAVGQFYKQFTQETNENVKDMLTKASNR
ncbi:MAG: phosphoribosyltransferase [Candidatus Lokiarchaeota archaeon]|nr:phosphoribosyltransferase [Candidatus Lokiarchaeota archaeon]